MEGQPEFVSDDGSIVLYHNDCLNVLRSLPDNSVQLVATDAPYYKVKSNAWDNQWKSVEDFLGWMDEILAEVWRVLKPNGSIYWFCSPKLSAETEMLIKQRFNVLNHLVWVKESGMHKGCNKESLRAYFAQTERFIFAEHYGAEGFAKGNSGYHVKCQQLKQQVFAPLINYFRDAKERLNIPAKAINKATGKQMCSHWFSSSQWQLPSEEDYLKLQTLFAEYGEVLEFNHDQLKRQHSGLAQEYIALSKQYGELKAEYESLRRPFSVTKHVPYTDVWAIEPVQAYPGKHPCEKPYDLFKHIVEASSLPGQVVIDLFMGSNVCGQVCKDLGRKYIGVEFERDTFDKAVVRVQ
jgi:site-specific DNA-methyltransferase (adenine-specific)